MIVYDLARLACGLCQVHVERIECGNHVQTTNQEFTPILLNLTLRVVGCLLCSPGFTRVSKLRIQHHVSSWRGRGKTMTYMTHHRDSIWLQEWVTQPVLGMDTLSCRLGWLKNISNVIYQTNRHASRYIQAQHTMSFVRLIDKLHATYKHKHTMSFVRLIDKLHATYKHKHTMSFVRLIDKLHATHKHKHTMSFVRLIDKIHTIYKHKRTRVRLCAYISLKMHVGWHAYMRCFFVCLFVCLFCFALFLLFFWKGRYLPTV